jgi:hypothetical protein
MSTEPELHFFTQYPVPSTQHFSVVPSTQYSVLSTRLHGGLLLHTKALDA